MARPVAVTLSAVVAILGSILALLFAAGAFVGMFFSTSQPEPDTTAYSAVGAAIIGALGIVGIWTGVGLFRLRPVARVSVLVFSTFLAAISLFALLIFAVVPIPPDISADTVQTFRSTTMIGAAVPLAISIWWLIQFNMQSTKAAFVSSSPTESQSTRPLTITVIAWMSILGGIGCLFSLLARTPAFLLGATFTGWTAAIYYALFAAVSFYIGKGLLDLNERARVVAIAWYSLSLLHLLVIEIVPSLRARMIALQHSLARDQAAVPFGLAAFTAGILVITGIVVLAAIWFLVRERAAFTNAATAHSQS